MKNSDSMLDTFTSGDLGALHSDCSPNVLSCVLSVVLSSVPSDFLIVVFSWVLSSALKCSLFPGRTFIQWNDKDVFLWDQFAAKKNLGSICHTWLAISPRIALWDSLGQVNPWPHQRLTLQVGAGCAADRFDWSSTILFMMMMIMMMMTMKMMMTMTLTTGDSSLPGQCSLMTGLEMATHVQIALTTLVHYSTSYTVLLQFL